MSDRILIVDDSAANLESLADFLNTEYTVDTAGSAEAAVAKVQQERYKVLIMDIKMPEMDGIGLYKKLRTYDAGFRVIFYSAYPGEYGKAQECSEIGLYVRKGTVEDLEVLIKAVDRLAGRSS